MESHTFALYYVNSLSYFSEEKKKPASFHCFLMCASARNGRLEKYSELRTQTVLTFNDNKNLGPGKHIPKGQRN